MSDIFVSYVEEDSSLAIQIVEMLEQAGYSTWSYERDGVPGLKFISQITQAIAEARAVVLVISVQSMSSEHVDTELFQAYDRKKCVIPLMIGVTYEEIRRRRPDWATMLGATVSVPVDASTVAGVVTRVIQSLKTQGIQPTRKPDKPVDQPAAHEPSVKIAEPRLSEKPADQKLPAEPFRDIPVDKRRRSLNPVWIGLGVMVVIAIIVAVVLYSCRGNPASNIGNNTPTPTQTITVTPTHTPTITGWGCQKPLSQENTLWGVWSRSSGDVFAVGGSGTILHYNGSSWSSMSSGTLGYLYGVWGDSSGNVFAVGHSGTILHYDGSRWISMSSNVSEHLDAIWGISGGDVFAVGDRGTILHYNGIRWSSMSSGTVSSLESVWGSSGSDVFAVGGSGTILHYDGIRWSSMSSGTSNYLYGVWGSSGSDVFAVGGSGTILHYDGNRWSFMTSDISNNLNGVWGNSSSDVFTVGDAGVAMHYFELQPNTSACTGG